MDNTNNPPSVNQDPTNNNKQQTQKEKDNLINTYINTFKDGFKFDGRTSRKEYWTFMLGNFIIGTLLSTVEGIALETSMFSSLFELVIFIPFIAAGIRRMHDIGKSGWFFIIPVVGFIFTLFKGNEAENKYGLPN